MNLKTLKKYLVWTRRVVFLVILFLLFASFLVASIFWMMSGVDPVEGDTYSDPGANLLGTIVIFGTIYVAWVRSQSTKESQDANAHTKSENPSDANNEQPLPPDAKIPD